MNGSQTEPARELTRDVGDWLRLIVYPPNADAYALWFDLRSLDIGRDDTNGLAIADSRISGHHLRLRRRRDTGVLEATDQKTTNGTFLNGQRIQHAMVNDNDVLRLGDTLIICELDSKPADWSDSPIRSLSTSVLERAMKRVTSDDAPTLILGPTGAGKGFFAERVAGTLGRRPFVSVNCAALPENLIESELFGHARGAFTGADSEKLGLVASAHGGVLFLDEVGVVPPTTQAKLLTCIESKSVRPIGSTRTRPIEIRVIAATNEDVDSAMATGRFRTDLYFRLAAHVVHMPALAERRADILELLSTVRPTLGDHRSYSAEAIEALLVHTWPGNIRELLNLGRLLKDEPGPALDYDLLPREITGFLQNRVSGKRRKAPSKATLEAELELAGGNVSELARRLGKHRNQVVRWLKGYGLE